MPALGGLRGGDPWVQIAPLACDGPPRVGGTDVPSVRFALNVGRQCNGSPTDPTMRDLDADPTAATVCQRETVSSARRGSSRASRTARSRTYCGGWSAVVAGPRVWTLTLGCRFVSLDRGQRDP